MDGTQLIQFSEVHYFPEVLLGQRAMYKGGRLTLQEIRVGAYDHDSERWLVRFDDEERRFWLTETDMSSWVVRVADREVGKRFIDVYERLNEIYQEVM